MALSWCVLTFTLALRWIINGTIPLANGYETMLLLSWLIMIVSILTTRKLQLMTTFGLIMSGFMLLVSHLGEMDPSITPRMPVLNSPLLSIHVSIIMMSYALLSLTFISAIAYFFTRNSKRESVISVNKTTDRLVANIPLSCYHNIRIRHLYRCYLGKYQLGNLLGMGP